MKRVTLHFAVPDQMSEVFAHELDLVLSAMAPLRAWLDHGGGQLTIEGDTMIDHAALAAAALADARWMLTGYGYSDEDADIIAALMRDSGVDLEDSSQIRGWLRQHGHQWTRSYT